MIRLPVDIDIVSIFYILLKLKHKFLYIEGTRD